MHAENARRIVNRLDGSVVTESMRQVLQESRLQWSNTMTHPRIQIAPQSKVIAFIAEAFNVVTITLVGVLGVLTVAATI